MAYSPTARGRGFLRVTVDHTDGMRALTIAGAAGLGVAVAMAIFGLPPIDIHGPLHYFGIMDPLCGGTRAARLTAQGHLAEAWRYNPLGILATTAAAAAVLRFLVGATTRRWINARLHWTPTRLSIAIAMLIIVTAALEIRQQGRADLLLQRH